MELIVVSHKQSSDRIKGRRRVDLFHNTFRECQIIARALLQLKSEAQNKLKRNQILHKSLAHAHLILN